MSNAIVDAKAEKAYQVLSEMDQGSDGYICICHCRARTGKGGHTYNWRGQVWGDLMDLGACKLIDFGIWNNLEQNYVKCD